jgi:CRISPR-associated protein Csm2
MTQSPNSPNRPISPVVKSPNTAQPRSDNRYPSGDRYSSGNIVKTMLDQISNLKAPEDAPEGTIGTLKNYPIRELVKHAAELGPELKHKRLETNQIRKFLDAMNQIKSEMASKSFEEMEIEIVLLKPKLAYAAARQQDAVKLLNQVISAAIDHVKSKEDFERLVQLMESIIAYHKAVEGK